MTCHCGNPSQPNDHLCAKCRYFQTVFRPEPPMFESKREMALRAIYNKRVMKENLKITVTG